MKKAYYYIKDQKVMAKSEKRLDIECHCLIYDDADAGKVGDKVLFYLRPPGHKFVKTRMKIEK